MMKGSKPLAHADRSGFDFVVDMLQGDPTYAINFDRLQYHPTQGYIIFEFLLCDERQTVTPYTSHPNHYWHLNAQKFIALFRAAKALQATLYLVNYAQPGTAHADEVLILKVLELNETQGITAQEPCRTTRRKFSAWFRKLNQACAHTR